MPYFKSTLIISALLCLPTMMTSVTANAQSPYCGQSVNPYCGGQAQRVYTAPSYSVPYQIPSNYVHSGQFVSEIYALPPVMVHPAPVMTRMHLAGPPLVPTIVRGPHRVEPAPLIRAERVVIQGECPASTTAQADGTCLGRHVAAPAPIYRLAPQPERCPEGSTRQASGICLSPTIEHRAHVPMPPKPAIIHHPVMPAPVTCHAPKQVQHNTTCKQSGGYVEAVSPQTYDYESKPTPKVMAEPVLAGGPTARYCYKDSQKSYDSQGRKIKDRKIKRRKAKRAKVKTVCQ